MSGRGDEEARRRRLLVGLIARDLLFEVHGALRAAEVPMVALKGVALHLADCRPPVERSLVDVDVLVRERDSPRAAQALSELGFVELARTGWASTYGRRGTPLALDVHHQLFRPGLFRLATEGVLARAVDARGVPIPAPLDLYAHLVGHWVKGRLKAEDRTHLEDFGAVSTRFDLAPASVARHLDAHGLGRAARLALGLARDRVDDRFAASVLGELEPDPIGERLARAAARVLERLPTAARAGFFVPHALNVTLAAGVRSLSLHARGATRRIVT